MSSQRPIENTSNTKSAEQQQSTLAFHKKRARRVSFAENTSVHIFNRDEDSGTPVNNAKPPDSPSDNYASAERNNEPNRMFWSSENNDDVEDEEDEEMDEDESSTRSPFLRLVGSSPSSGGSTIGSATSNDEDNFFGPVSANFIRRDILDREASDGNHDQTMDSTAFSMHFRSLARSDSEVELKTSSGSHLSFGDKTPTQDSGPTNTGNLMLMTQANKPNHQPIVSTSKLNTSSESNDMSIVGEYRFKYDYGELSPTLDPLLAEGNNDLSVIAPSNVSLLKSPRFVGMTKDVVANQMDLSGGEDNNSQEIITQEKVNEVALKHDEVGVINDGAKLSPNKQISSVVSYDAEISKHLSHTSSMLVTPKSKTPELVKDPYQIKSSLDFTTTSQGSLNQQKPPTVGVLNSVTDMSSQIHFNGVSPSKLPPAVTPLHNHLSVFVEKETPKHSQSVLSIQKSISKLKMIKASPFSADLTAKLDDSASRSVLSPSKMTPNTLLEKNHRASSLNYMNDSGHLSAASQKKRERVISTNMDSVRLETPKTVVPLTHVQNFVKLASPLLIPPESTWSGEKSQTELLSLENGHDGDQNTFSLPESFGYSSQKKLKVMDTSKFKSSPLKDTNQLTEDNGPAMFGPRENVTNESLSAIDADNTDAMCIERIEKDSPLIPTEDEMVDIREVSLNEVRSNLEAKENATTLLKDNQHEQTQSKFTGSDFAMGETQRPSLVLQSCQKNLHDEFCQSPLSKNPHDVLHDENIASLREEIVQSLSPHCISNGDVISEQRRMAEDRMVERTNRTQRSPNYPKGYAGAKLASDSEIHKFKHPTEVNAMFSRETKELLPQTADKLNLHAIDTLESILDQFLRSKTYQLLSDEIKSQKSVDASKYLAHKRASETKLLVCKLVYEKAKLQLMNVKRERLLKSAGSLAPGILESEALRSNFPPHQSSDALSKSLSVSMNDLPESQIDSDKVTSMGQDLDRLDRRIANLTKSFHKLCKMKGDPTARDTIALANTYVTKRACCQIIRKDLQLWVVDNLESRNGCHNVALNYLDLMTQRLTVKAGPVPTITVSHELNNVNITKIFKDMDAYAAFGFVFNADTTQKHADATSLAQETQVTGSRFGNLLDVMEEIQHARVELKNLVTTRFYSPSAEQLNLELCFVDPKHRRKATVTLDTSCLQRGIYPSEIVPYQIDHPIDEPQSSPSLSAEIASALQDLKVGYLRILRLCTCISKLISPTIRLAP